MNRFGVIVAAGWILALVFVIPAAGQVKPGYFAFEVAMPSGALPLAMPAGAYYETAHEELYIADAGNSRIVIFDKNGSFLYEFADPEYLTGPRSIAVDGQGRILVLPGHQRDRLVVYDYDGTFLGVRELVDPVTDSTVNAASFVIGTDERVYVLNEEPARILVFSETGEALSSFPLLDDFEHTEFDLAVLGSLAWANGELIIPLPVVAQIAVYTPEGDFVRIFGIAGGAPGEFSLPVAACATASGGLLVLDKHRHTLLQFTREAKFIREFGGMGVSHGWFYHPHTVCSDGAGQYFVLQFFQNRIQAVRIPGEELPAARLPAPAVDGAVAEKP